MVNCNKIIVSMLVLCISINCYQCKKSCDDSRIHISGLEALSDSVTYYENKLKSTTASIKTLKLETSLFKKEIIEKDKEIKALASEFKRVEKVTKFNTITQIDSVVVVYKDSLPLVFSKVGKLENKWYNFRYRSTQNQFIIDSLQIPTTTTVITGVKQKWFLGEQTFTTDITNSNPYITIKSISAADVLIEQPWYKKWYIWLATGLLGGVIISR